MGKDVAYISLPLAQNWAEMSLHIKSFQYLKLNEGREGANLPLCGHLYIFSIQHTQKSLNTHAHHRHEHIFVKIV